MAEEIASENGRISNFQWLVTFTLDRVILHTIMHHSSTFTMPNFIRIEETFCGRTDGRRYVRTFETHFIRSTQKSRPNKSVSSSPKDSDPGQVKEGLTHIHQQNRAVENKHNL